MMFRGGKKKRMMPNDQGKGKYCMRHNTVMGEQSPDIIIGEQGKKN